MRVDDSLAHLCASLLSPCPFLMVFRIFGVSLPKERCLLHPPKTCAFAASIKLSCILTRLFWGAVDSFAGLFDRFHYIFTGESTSKADTFDNLRSMKLLNAPLTQKRPGIGSKMAGIAERNKGSRPKRVQSLGLAPWIWHISSNWLNICKVEE